MHWRVLSTDLFWKTAAKGLAADSIDSRFIRAIDITLPVVGERQPRRPEDSLKTHKFEICIIRSHLDAPLEGGKRMPERNENFSLKRRREQTASGYKVTWLEWVLIPKKLRWPSGLEESSCL